jgi:hypothetical protein
VSGKRSKEEVTNFVGPAGSRTNLAADCFGKCWIEIIGGVTVVARYIILELTSHTNGAAKDNIGEGLTDEAEVRMSSQFRMDSSLNILALIVFSFGAARNDPSFERLGKCDRTN